MVGQFADSVEDEIDDLLADGVVTAGVVVGGVFLAGDELFGVEELAISSGPDLIDDGGFEIDENGAGYVLAGAGFREERGEGIVSDGLVRRHGAIGLDSVFEAVQFPAGIAHLDSGLADMN